MDNPHRAWWKRVHLRYTAANIGLPLFVLYFCSTVPCLWRTGSWTVAYSLATGLSITAGKFIKMLFMVKVTQSSSTKIIQAD